MFRAVTDTAGANGVRMQGYVTIPAGFPCGKYDIPLRILRDKRGRVYLIAVDGIIK